MSEYKPIDECKTVYEILEDPKRWGQKSAVDQPGCECVSTAIGRLSHTYEAGEEMQRKFLATVGVMVPACASPTDLMTSIWSWNDAPERTHAEVLAAVRKAGI